MNTITKLALITFLATGMLVSCAQPNPHPMDMTSAVQSAKTKADHEALAAHYEQAAKDALAKVQEHKKILDEYKAKSYLYGKQAAMLEQHCQSLIQSYQQVADANLQMAQTHRQMGGN
jgi:RecB family exonuclease